MKKRSKIESVTVYNGDLDAMQRRFMADFYNVLPLGFVSRDRDETPIRMEWCYSEKQREVSIRQAKDCSFATRFARRSFNGTNTSSLFRSSLQSSQFMFRADLLVHFLDIRELKANITDSSAKAIEDAKAETNVKETTIVTDPFGRTVTTTKTTDSPSPTKPAHLSYAERKDKYNKDAVYPINTAHPSYSNPPKPANPLNFAEVTPVPLMYGGALGSLRKLAPRAFYEGDVTYTSESQHGMELSVRRAVAAVKVGPWDFFLDFEER